jgi:hypothetical protein
MPGTVAHSKLVLEQAQFTGFFNYNLKNVLFI